MIPKSELKKFQKDLRSKHVITRLDALHDLKKHDLEAVVFIDILVHLVKNDEDDMVRFNSLDILAILAGESEVALQCINEAATSEQVGVSRKAQRLLTKIKSVLEDILETEEEEEVGIEESAEPLSDELFERIETPISTEGGAPAPIPAPTIPQPASFQTTTDEQFDESELGKESDDLTPKLVEHDVSNIPLPASSGPPSVPSVPSTGP
ncbi:MAG: hypothetical protein ACTSQF_16215, partial [Candidatus Heimdallarchaeaceae archaeon]